MTVVLEHLTRDIQRQIGGVHNTPYKAEVFGNELLAVFGNHNAAGVELQSLFVVL